MTIYPVHRSWRSILWFTAAVLLVFAVTIGLYRIAFAPPTADRWLMALSMAGLALAALLAGGTAYGLHWIQRAPRLGSTVFAGYALAGVFICLALGWLSLVLPLAPHERGLPLLLLFFVVSLALALGYLHASMVSARAEALIGVADALRLGHYHARVDMAGHDQLARLGETLNSLAERLEGTKRKGRHLKLELHAGGAPMSPLIARQLLVRWQASCEWRHRRRSKVVVAQDFRRAMATSAF